MKNIDTIMSELDLWTASCGTGTYLPDDLVFEDYGSTLRPIPMVGCQQIRQEIKEFGEILTQQPWYGTGTGVEIGLGFYGSTHIFWRNFFAKTITIEYEPHRIRKFKEHTYQYYKKNVLDEGSYFINNYSYSPEAVGKLYNFTDKIDFLFIDGDHIYQAALTDWLLYSPLVAKGGIVAFHDSCCEGFGVSEFLKDLQTGAFGEAPKVELIQHSKCVGISYYFKP